MKKFILVLFASAGLLSIGGYWLSNLSLPELLDSTTPCPFCSENVLKAQTVFAGKHYRALYNYKPMVTGHILLIPNRHIERFEEMSAEETGEMVEIAKRVQRAYRKAYGKADYILLLQNGYFGGQTVPHAHFHMIPRGKEEGTLGTKFHLWKMAITEIAGLREPLTEEQMNKEINNLRA